MNKQLYPVRVSVPFEENPLGIKIEMLALTPKQAVKYRCLDCCGGEKEEIKTCNVKSCVLYQYRRGHKGRVSVKLIREFCKDCMNGYADYIKGCTDKECSLYPFRMETNPNWQISLEERERRADNMKRNRAFRKAR